ncbi:hypothetical protein P152DRAFT_446685 [Eremomyces bilateralis CBS 781.70]|uniref:Transposase Tc1-like domain-containing protein n=1 Tax=Eremomyces bilateralis CBS 781.70 TaxID=1392243 RepID=A0A6G1GCL2_9PEZI|nr:uncharacterized protein P152DRAFT_446685 [Eremomyces bilateralis CBS 781.70]KAF1815640.1 hypothetical protein P152DRAFT_446685 [Eremomyces bilateralis CBS 781.70]
MPPIRQTRRVAQRHNLSITQLTTIAVCRHFGQTFPQISTELRIPTTSVSSAYQRVYGRAKDFACLRVGGGENLPLNWQPSLLDFQRSLDACAQEEEHRGRPATAGIVKDALRDTATRDEQAQDKPWTQVAREVSENLGIPVPKTTAYRILKDEFILRRRRPPRKLELTPWHKNDRKRLASWALPNLENGDIFIFTDEMLVNTNNSRKPLAVTRPRGANPFDFSRSPPDVFQAIMFWGAICWGYDLEGTGPCHAWEAETQEERETIDRTISDENQVMIHEMEHDRAEARRPGTRQYRHLQELNVNIQRENQEHGTRHARRRPEWEFKQELAKRDKAQDPCSMQSSSNTWGFNFGLPTLGFLDLQNFHASTLILEA